MTWFGWLTKGQYEISAIDKFICLGEILGLLLIVFIVYAYACKIRRWFKDTL